MYGRLRLIFYLFVFPQNRKLILLYFIWRLATCFVVSKATDGGICLRGAWTTQHNLYSLYIYKYICCLDEPNYVLYLYPP